ncbi:MAG: DUF4351 domain-containing protein [Magnetococcales bacterium]|nr:DUF4351 domain-containing protein [Magnetococcales bacterium]
MRLLTRRFGDLPAEVHAKVNAAEMDTLESWIDQLLDAHSLNDVFLRFASKVFLFSVKRIFLYFF